MNQQINASGSSARSLTVVFVIGILLALFFAWLAPTLGTRGGVLKIDIVTRIGVVLIFFFQGVGLQRKQLAAGLLAWRFHVWVQLFIFGVMPLLTGLLLFLAGPVVPYDLHLGFLYLAILPTTVSSAVVMVTATGGDLPSAIFNATLSNLAGIVWVPMVCAWFLSTAAGEAMAVGPMLGNVTTLLLLPLVLGQVCQRFLQAWVRRHKKKITHFNNTVIFLMVYSALCRSFVSRVWDEHGVSVVLVAGLGAMLLLVLATMLAWFGGRLVGFTGPQRLTALFCGTQKTLLVGVPMAEAVFATIPTDVVGRAPTLSLVILPLVFYHPLQLMVGGALLSLFENEVPRNK